MIKKICTYAILLGVVSCSSEADTVTSESNPLVGVWKMEKTITISGSDNTTQISEYNPDSCKQKSTHEFTQDGKYIINDYNSVGLECKYSNSTKTYTYLKNENKLIIGSATAKILEVSNNKLVLYIADNYDSNNDGVNDYLKYVFKK